MAANDAKQRPGGTTVPGGSVHSNAHIQRCPKMASSTQHVMPLSNNTDRRQCADARVGEDEQAWATSPASKMRRKQAARPRTSNLLAL
eukprot:2203344-Alexandrium_andersonii.AAC.1